MKAAAWLAVLASIFLSSSELVSSEENFFPHEHDAESYYLLVDNKKLLFSCPENKIFDSNLKQCVYNDGTGCTQTLFCGVDDWGVLLPYPPDCSKYIYCGQGGQEIISSCYANLQFSPENLECMHPELANCPNCQVTTTTSPCSTIPTCSEEDEGLNKPYPPDCKLYIYCGENSEEQISFCPPNLYFSPVELQCLPKEEAQCPNCEEITSTTEAEATTTPPVVTTQSTTQIPTETTTAQALETTVGICPPTPECFSSDIGYNKPYPPDCKKYIYCNEVGPGRLRTCPSGLLYSSELDYCTSPEEANCPYCEVATTTLEPTTTVTTIGFCPPTPTCSETEEGHVKPYPSDCTLFIYCDVGGEEFISVCPSGLQFSPTLLRCVNPILANCPVCEVYVTTTTLGICSEAPKCEASDQGLSKPYPSDCTKYIYCEEEGDGELSSCRPGYEFSPSLLWCVPASASNCPICIEITTVTTREPEPTTIPYCPETPMCLSSDVYDSIPFPSDCTKYVYCKTEGTGTIRTCPLYQEFDPVLRYCVPTEESTCPFCLISTTTDLPTTTELTTKPTEPTTTDSTTDISTSTTTASTSTTELTTSTTELSTSTTELSTSTTELSTSTTELSTSTTELSTSTTELSTSTTELSTSTTEVISTTTTTEATTTEEGCPQIPTCFAGELGKQKRYPPDCRSYINCDTNEIGPGVIRKCPLLGYFHPTKLVCESRLISVCEQCTPPTLPPTTTTVKVPTCSPTPDCIAKEDGALLPYPPDCTQYIYCENEIVNLTPCKDNFHYSESLMRCVDPNAANCEYCIESIMNTATKQIQPETKSFSWNFWTWFK